MIDYDWKMIPRETVAMRGETVSLRPLAKDDEAALGDYFLGLSAPTRRVYAPHPFDRATAATICAGLDTPQGRCYLRLVAAVGSKIVGYFILYLGLHETDRVRRYGDMDPATTCTLAPSVADDWQNQGLGSRLMVYAKDCARVFRKNTMVLWGGVRESNVRAVHFYYKSGFRKCGEFLLTIVEASGPEQINNLDMATEL